MEVSIYADRFSVCIYAVSGRSEHGVKGLICPAIFTPGKIDRHEGKKHLAGGGDMYVPAH